VQRYDVISYARVQYPCGLHEYERPRVQESHALSLLSILVIRTSRTARGGKKPSETEISAKTFVQLRH